MQPYRDTQTSERPSSTSGQPAKSSSVNLGNCLRDRQGASGAEYALILAIIGAIIAIAALGIADAIGNRISGTARQVSLPASTDIREGQAAFIKPDNMMVGRWYSIEFVAGPTLKSLRVETQGRPVTKPSPIYVSESMRVRLLKDPNFEIKPKSEDLKQTGQDMAAAWQWDIKPIAAGTHTLIAQVEVLKRRQDGGYDRFDQYSRAVSVNVTVGRMQSLLDGIRDTELLGGALGGLFSTLRGTLMALVGLVTAAFAVWWGIRKFRRRAPRSDELEGSDRSTQVPIERPVTEETDAKQEG